MIAFSLLVCLGADTLISKDGEYVLYLKLVFFFAETFRSFAL